MDDERPIPILMTDRRNLQSIVYYYSYAYNGRNSWKVQRSFLTYDTENVDVFRGCCLRESCRDVPDQPGSKRADARSGSGERCVSLFSVAPFFPKLSLYLSQNSLSHPPSSVRPPPPLRSTTQPRSRAPPDIVTPVSPAPPRLKRNIAGAPLRVRAHWRERARHSPSRSFLLLILPSVPNFLRFSHTHRLATLPLRLTSLFSAEAGHRL
ncbi:hypothetical protein MTO96_015451 [Rhipicephalus appendiculatus]